MDENLRFKLNEIVLSYLSDGEFKETSEVFRTECKQMGQICLNEEQKTKIVAYEEIEKLLEFYDSGVKDDFFKAFEAVIPAGISNDSQNQEYLQLECHLQLHFATFGLINVNDEALVKQKLENGMLEFKRYLESKGSILSKESDYLSYFALPFIENPIQHMSFTEIFQESWVQRVRNDLKSYVTKYGIKPTKPTEMVTLATLYEQHQHYNQLEKLIDTIQIELRSKNEDLAKLQMNYQNLMKMTVELLSALETMVKGAEVNLSHVVDICLTAFPDLFPTNADLNKILDDRVTTTESTVTTEKTFSDRNRNYSSNNSKAYHWNLVNLDYKKLKQDLVSGPLRLKIFILQALRWRLTRSPPGAKRRSVLQDYIHNDLLGVQGGIYNSSISQLLLSPISELRQTMFRLLNSFASLSTGRSYLSQKSGILSSMMDSVLYDKLEQLSLDMALAALQKLSLRRELQTAMIQRDIIEKLIVFLRDGDCLSDYSLEYVVALLMNLCLRSAGKQRCAKHPMQVLKVLTNLLGTQNQDIIPYVNGTLYSLLTNPAIRKEALNIGLEDMLNCFMQECNSEIKRQLEFILKQLTSENPVENTISDFEDDDDEENDAMEEELDLDDSVAIVPGELQGELLLTTYYTLPSTKPNSKQSDELSVYSESPASLGQKSDLSPRHWIKRPLALTENDSIEESLSSTIWYPNQTNSFDSSTIYSHPKSPVLDHYATQVVTKVIGVDKPLSEAVEFPPVLPREADKHGKSSRPKIPRTPEHSANYQSRRAIKNEMLSPSKS